MKTRAPSFVLKMRMCLWARDTHLLAEGNVQTMQREHLVICVSSTIDFRSFIHGSSVGSALIDILYYKRPIDNNYYHDSSRAYIILSCYIID